MNNLIPSVTIDVLKQASISMLCETYHVSAFRYIIELHKGNKEEALKWLDFSIICREIVIQKNTNKRGKKERSSHRRMVKELREEYNNLDAHDDITEYKVLKRFLVGNAQDRGFPVKESLWPEGWNYVRYREETDKYTKRTGKVVLVNTRRSIHENGIN